MGRWRRRRPPWQGGPDAGYDANYGSAYPSTSAPYRKSGRLEGQRRLEGKGPMEKARRQPLAAPAPPARHPMASRVDHAARLLLSHMGFWSTWRKKTTPPQCASLRRTAPFVCVAGGAVPRAWPQPWAVLRESLRGHECEAVAVKVMTGAHAQTEGDEAELRSELTDLLARIQIEQLKEQLQYAPGQRRRSTAGANWMRVRAP